MEEEIKVTPKTETVEKATPSTGNEVPHYIPLQNTMEITNPNNEEVDQMKTVWDYFSQESKSPTETLWKIRQTENRLAAPRMGESRLAKIYQYAKLRIDIANNEKLLDEL